MPAPPPPPASARRLELMQPPVLVQVRDRDGEQRRALLLARRADRSYLQVSRAAGDNVLRWLPSGDVLPATAEPRPESRRPHEGQHVASRTP